MTIKLSTKVGSSLPKLAPDLTRPSRLGSSNTPSEIVTINPVGALTDIINKSGRFSLESILITGITLENITIKLTIDGVVIFNDTFVTAFTSLFLFGVGVNTTTAGIQGYLVETSILLQMQTATDTVVSTQFLLRPIL